MRKRVNRGELPSIIDDNEDEHYNHCLRAFCQVYDYLLQESFDPSRALVALADLSVNANLRCGGVQLAQMILNGQQAIVNEAVQAEQNH